VVATTTEMAVYHGRDNIRVNCVVPGHIYTPLVAGNQTPEVRDLRRRVAPLGTEGTAWDVAWAVVFLASDEARWITAVALPVDGGVMATTPLAMLHRLA
jgi:NAD(P)-dependent dehydrogenase (short-subunit alcohol dehydrogenase family)